MAARITHRAALAVALAAALPVAACLTGPIDPYPLHSGPDRGAMSSPEHVGTPAGGIVVYIKPRPGDRIELLDAEPIGLLPGADVTFEWAPPVEVAPGRWAAGAKGREPLAGSVATHDPAVPADHPGAILAWITARGPGRFSLTSIRLHYRLNGGPEQVREGIDVMLTVCAGEPPPLVCEPEDSSLPPG